MRHLRAFLLLAAGALASPARADSEVRPPLVPACPAEGLALLDTAPERLVPCLGVPEAARRAWAGHALRALGREAAAAEAFDSAAQVAKEPLATVLRLEAARSARRAGIANERERLGAPASPRWLRAEALAIRAELHFAAGRWREVLGDASAAIELDGPGPEALGVLALRAALETGDRAEALRRLTLLRTDFVGLGLDAEVERLAAAAKLPSLETLPPAQLAARWRRLVRRGGLAETAEECAARLPHLKGKDVPSAALECGRARMATRRPDAQRWLEAAARDARHAVDATLALARLAGRTDDPDAVARRCDALAKLPKSRDALAECRYLAAVLRTKKARPEGLAALARVVTEFAAHARAADARWLLVLDAFEQLPTDALARLDAMAATTRTADALAPVLYWRGRTHEKLGRTEPAKADWERAQTLDPFGYYGWLAALRLGEPTTPPKPSCERTHARPRSGAATGAMPAAGFATELLEAGFARHAAKELAQGVGPRSPDALAWAPMLESADAWTLLHRIGLARGGARAGWPVTDGTRAAVDATFPLAFPKARTDVAVDHCLVLSIMQRESLFDPAAVSQAKARGLMQLLPETAAQLANELGLPVPAPEELHAPGLNVRLAAHYLARLAERFPNPLLVAAAYNGGPRAVARWLESSKGTDFDLFVERIPYRETRHYVKAVGGSLAAYRRLASGVWPELPLGPVSPAKAGVEY